MFVDLRIWEHNEQMVSRVKERMLIVNARSLL